VIARIWTARATREGADRYQHHFKSVVLDKLKELDGFRGAIVLRDDDTEGHVKLTDLTFWDSLDTIEGFSAPDISTAVVDETAQSYLVDFDTTVTHSTVAVDTRTNEAPG
jgi:heme-degrading monooxygenase HmoA